MKKLFISLLLAALCTLANAETIYQSDFADNAGKPLKVWGKVENGMLSANGRYDFAGMLLNPSAKTLKISCTFKTEGDSAFGLILNGIENGRATKRLCSIVWNVKSPKEKTFSWTIDAKYLKKHTFLYLYCINPKKGTLHIKEFKIETVSPDVNAAIPGHLFYQSDFRKSAAPFLVWGAKLENGMLNSNKKYDFGGIILPASKQPYTVSCTIKCDPGTSLGVILFDEKNRKPVKRLLSVSWNVATNKDFRTYTWTLPKKYLTGNTFLIFYCINGKYGNVTMKELRIERTAEKLEIPELKKKRKLNDPFTLKEAAEMLQLTNFMKFHVSAAKTPAPERTDIFLGITTETLYGVALLHHPGRKNLKSGIHARDNTAIFKDDSIEFFISGPGKVQPYYHFAFNAAGSVFDALGETKSWNSNFRCAAQPFGREWTAIRFELPLQDIGYSLMEYGVLPANFGINFCRNHAEKKQYSVWGKVTSGFHEPAAFNRFIGYGKTGGIIAVSSHFSDVKSKLDLDEGAYWKNDKNIYSELFTKEDHPYPDFGSYIWPHPHNVKENTLYGLQYGAKYSHKEILDKLKNSKSLLFLRLHEIHKYADWAKKNNIGIVIYFRYYRSDSYPWDLSDDTTMKKKLEELDAVLTKYKGLIRGVELGDEALEVILGHELINAAGKRGGATLDEVKRVDQLIREKFGFGKYGLPRSLNAADQPFHQLATRRFILNKLQQMQKGIWEVCRKHKFLDGKKVLSISPTQRADNILTQQSRFGDWCDIMTTQIVPMGNPWRQTIAFNTKLIKDLSGKDTYPCAHLGNYHHSNNVEATAAYISEMYRGGATGMQLFLADVVGSYSKVGSSYHCYYGHRPRWDKIMEESKRFTTSKRLRFPKPEYAMFLSNDSALSTHLFTEKQCEWLFSLMGPGAGSSFRFISDTQILDKKINLKDFPFILLPAAPIQGKAVQKELENYVKNGGILICFDPKVFEQADDGSSTAAFREQLFGVKTITVAGGKNLTLKGYAKKFPLIGQKYALLPQNDVEVIGKAGKASVVTVKKYSGGGKAVMVAIGAEYYYAGQKIWRELAKNELKKLGATTDYDIWKFSLPYKKENRPEIKDVCLTGNYAYWYRNQFTPAGNKIPFNATYHATLVPDGRTTTKPIPFGKGNLMNRLDAVKANGLFVFANQPLIKAGKLSLDQFADTWTDTAPFEIKFDFGEIFKVSQMKLYWNGELPDFSIKFDNGKTLHFKGGTASEVGEKILSFPPTAARKLTLSLEARSKGQKLTLSEIEIWSKK